MAEESETTSTNIETPIGKFQFSGKKTAEFITVVLAIGVGIGAYIIWTHSKDSEASFAKIERAMNTMSGSQRFFACVIAHEQKERMQQIEQVNSLCNRMGKE